MREQLENVIAEVEKVIAGKRKVIEKILTALLAEGHILLDDVPGVGKTTLARLFAHAFEADFIALSAVFSGVKDIREAIRAYAK